MNCKELQDQVADYLAGRISPESLQLFEAHLMDCENCRVELEQMESTWMALGKLPAETPGPAMRSRFYAMLEEEKRCLARESRVSWYRRAESWIDSWWPRRPAVQMALIVVLMAAGLFAGSRLETAAPVNGEVAELRGEVQQMYQMVSLSLLNQDSSSDRLRGVNWSSRVTEPSDDLLYSLTTAVSADPNENVRLAAVDALSYFRGQPGVVDTLMRALSGESSPMVQVALIDVLIAVQETKTLEALKRFVEQSDASPPVKQHAESRMTEFL
jgi:anti-sigma factor RsiW